MTGVHVQLAGQFTVTVEGQAVDAVRLARRDTLLLAYLVLERGRWVAQSELADVLWDDRLPATWKTALRGGVSRVRSVLAEAGLPSTTLATRVGSYELRLPTETTVDVESAATAVSAAADLVPWGRPVTHLATSSPLRAPARGSGLGGLARARTLATEALGVARRPFLVGVHAAWVDQRQQLLEDLRLRCLEVLAVTGLHSGDWAVAREHAVAALGLAPLRESVHRLLALAHAGGGDRGEALRVLTACRQVLAEELGAPLSPETEALSVGLLRGAPLPELLADAASSTGEVRLPAAAALDELTDSSMPLIGRELEASRLLEAWKRAIGGGAPELAIVAGEAGAGKSRLVAHLARMVADSGATVLWGRCDDGFGGGVLVEALRGHALFAAEAPSQSALAEAVRSTLCRLGARAPILLVLDDLQALDRAGLSLVRYLLRCPDPLPLLVVGTFRTGEAESDRRLATVMAAGRGVRPVTSIDLAGLADTEVADLVRQVAGYPPDPALRSSIVDATGGNPLFVRELVRLWLAQGRTAVDGDALTLPSVGDAVPDGVRETIRARCQGLRAAALRVLTVAALAGREVDLAQLEVVPALSTVDVLAALEEAVGAGLMVERSAGRFGFVHGLVPETLRRELSAARRQRLHVDLATALEARPGTAAPDPARIAYHLLRGGPAVAERAVVAASRAAAEAQHRDAYAEAAEYYAGALAVAGADPVVACRLRLEQAWALWRAGEMASAQEAFWAAATTARAAGRPDLAGHAVFGAAGHGPSLGFCDDQLAGEITAALRELAPDDPFRPRLLARLGAEVAGSPDPAAADRCRDAVALAEAGGDPCSVAYALHCLNWASLADAADRDGLVRAEKIVETGQLLGDRHMELEGRLWRCTFLLRAGRIEEVRAEAAALAQSAAALRQPFFLRLPPRLRITLALVEGRDAAALAAELYPAERSAHPRDAEVHALLRDVALAHARGRWPDLDRRLRVVPDGSAPGDAPTWHAPHWSVVRGVWLAASGFIEDGAAVLGPVLADDAAALRHNPLAPFVGALLARACVANRRFAELVEVAAVRSLLRPWAGTHAVAGCAVASLGPVDDYLTALDALA